MSNVDFNILTPDTLAALSALAANMVQDCKTVAAVESSDDLIPALSNVAERGHEAGTVAHGDIVRKIMSGATKSDVLRFMNQDKGSRGGKAIAGSIMRGLRALAAKDSPSGHKVKDWLADETLKFDGDAKVFHFAEKTVRETLKSRLIELIGEGSDDDLIARVEGMMSKVEAAHKASAESEAKAVRLAEELAAAKVALQQASKASKATGKATGKASNAA